MSQLDLFLRITVTVNDEYTIGSVVSIVIGSMFASPHGLMSERSADDQWRHVLDNTEYRENKGN